MAIAEFLIYCKQLATASADSTDPKETRSAPSVSLYRDICIRDFLYLEFLCQVCPDDEFDFEALLMNPEEAACYYRSGNEYLMFAKIFKLLRARRNRDATETSNDTDSPSGSDADLLALLAFQQAMQMQEEEVVLEIPFVYDSDDSD